MDSSTLRFKNVNFIVEKPKSLFGGEKEVKNILTDVSGTVKWGHVLAIMGPSGAGKTTLINALTLDAFYGKPVGKVTLNGVPMTPEIFKQHCYVVVQHDKHWPYLKCRETLRYCAQLYDVAAAEDIDTVVDEIITKMGLQICADTRNARLSGGQARRLSIGIALLKQPTLLFLDEPTSGLDAAAAANIMQEIVRVAKEERIIIVCTIHQPSTKVYEGFDEVMIMSRGRQAFSGDVSEAIPYFESIGYPLPDNTNPAEFFLDIVNSDFSDEAEVTNILDMWEEKRPDGASSSHHKKGFDEDEQEGVTTMKRLGFVKEMMLMFRRHATLIIRDPILYVGRCFVFLVSTCIFALVYLSARDLDQAQVYNIFWLLIWFIGVPSNMGVVAVYALNDEFKTIVRESKNGMVTGVSYVIAKTLLVLPIFLVFGIFALSISLFAIIGAPAEPYGILVLLFAIIMFVFESVAECFSVWFDDPILGMMQYMNFWFGAFLFGGFLIAEEDIVWPFRVFYYIMPFSYYIHSVTYELYNAIDWDDCVRDENTRQAICESPGTPENVLDAFGNVMPIVNSENRLAQNIGIMLAIGGVYKLMFIVGVLHKTSRSAKIKQTD